MNIDDWKSQIKRGTLDFCILLMIRQRPSYGYEIISTLEKYPILAAKENTIYPLLRRPDFYSFAVKINTINTQKTRNLNISGFFCYFLFALCSIYAIIRCIYTWRLT